jgi:AcrR family transcriptional regulator
MSRSANSRAGELTREDVITAAAGLVAERGYSGLSMRALAQRCGVAKCSSTWSPLHPLTRAR